jgi:Leucine-rich repeat (LRR) protein
MTYKCHLDQAVAISTPSTKFANERNELVTEIQGSENRGIESIPVDIVEVFPKVKKIYFESDSVKSVSKKSFRGLVELELLFFVENPAPSIDEDSFDDLAMLDCLSLALNKLKSLPTKIFAKLENLQTLYLYGNELTSLHPEIFKNNHKLAIIDLGRNKLTTFAPETFEPLSLSLETLDLRLNQISSLNNNWFKNCVNMTRLHLDNNRISEIPHDFLATFSYLSTFTISSNPIPVIDFSIFQHNKDIYYVDFKGLGVEKVLNLDVVDTLPRLEFLKFRNNKCASANLNNKKDMKKSLKNCVRK